MSIEVFNEDPTQDVNEDMLIDVATFALARMDVHPAAELSLHIVDEPTIADLHVRWLDLEGPTDVMSFPMDELTPGTQRPDAGEPGPSMLGDIVLCPEFAAKQARHAGHSLAHELALLTVHGVLHVLGYDHAEPEDEKRMFSLQNTILSDWYSDCEKNSRTFQPRPTSEKAFPSAADRLDLDAQMAESGHIPPVAASAADTDTDVDNA